MKSRREFFKSMAAAGVAGSVGPSVTNSLTQSPQSPGWWSGLEGRDDRRYWVSVLEKLATPVLGNLSKRELKKNMPVEAADPAERRRYTHLEAFGRLLAGIAPWLALTGLEGDEAKTQSRFLEQSQLSLAAATDPQSPDFMNFNQRGQPLVDAAFLAQGILRAPRVLWEPLDPRVRRQIIEALKSSRAIATPTDSNWVMFAATVEAALLEAGEPTIEDRLEGSLRRMLGWYKGDGAYGDGEWFHFDYYNSFVIQPMLVDVLAALRRRDRRYEPAYGVVLRRARRFAEIQERLIAPDGTFPSIGRSTTYRFGAMQTLAQMSLLEQLPERVKPAQVRGALTAVMRRSIEAPGTFDENGWLRIGFCGHQASLAEGYISTGSLYLCSVGLLPLGLPPAHVFWNGPAERWTSQRIWSGESLPPDHALADQGRTAVEVPALKRNAAAN
jgi:hypothetical protein